MAKVRPPLATLSVATLSCKALALPNSSTPVKIDAGPLNVFAPLNSIVPFPVLKIDRPPPEITDVTSRSGPLETEPAVTLNVFEFTIAQGWS